MIDGLIEDVGWRQAWLKAARSIAKLPSVTILLLSATVSPQFEHLIFKALGVSQPSPLSTSYIIRQSTIRTNISYQVVNFTLQDQNAALKKGAKKTFQNLELALYWKVKRAVEAARPLLKSDEKIIIFFKRKDLVEKIAGYFKGDKVNVTFVTGDTSDDERVQRWKSFYETVPIMLTNKAGYYGVDHPAIAFVVWAETPTTMLDFSQASGRLGRSGRLCTCVILDWEGRKTWDLDQDETFSGHGAMEKMVTSDVCLRIEQGQFLDGVIHPTCITLLLLFDHQDMPIGICSVCASQLDCEINPSPDLGDQLHCKSFFYLVN